MSDEVFDLDAVAAEANGAPFEFTYNGQQWSIAHLKSFGRQTRKVLRAVGDDDDAAVEIMLTRGMGKEQYERWVELDVGAGPEDELFNRWLDHCGVSPGKSPSSTGSSESTARPSKRASKRPTKSASAASSTGRSRRAGSSSS